MSWPRQVVRTGGGIDGHLDGAGAVERRNAGGNALARIDGLAEGGAELGSVLAAHGTDAQVLQTFFRHGQADQAAPVTRHEINPFGSYFLGSQCEIAFVL